MEPPRVVFAIMLRTHRVHDYKFLIRRWRAVARASGLRMAWFTEMSGHRVFYLESKKAPASADWIYLSAGIHGDEPAAPEALICWAETHLPELRAEPFLLFPCLNPWGLVNNRRVDEMGLDLNRVFHRDDLPFVQEWRRVLAGRRCKMVVALHEDFDAQGLYLYEIPGERPHWGEALLDAARPFLPPDPRKRIEGRGAKNGLIRPRLNMKFFAEIGLPEAAYLRINHSRRTFTIESPSEFALDLRVQAHVAILNEAIWRAR